MADEPDDVLRLAREIADAYRTGTPASGRTTRRPIKRRGPARRPGREDAVALGDVLGEMVQHQGWEERLAASRVFSDWASIVGPEVAQHCQVDHFTDGVVYLETSSTAWAKELKMLAPRLVAKLNQELGDGQVLRIDVRGPQAPSWKKGRRSVKGRGPRDTYG
ncbi:DciA family protein [Aeromicrobium sp.]|uniref:DUF721 domain-containing protein n=1 Tax=Aeromicrobium sp. TaxID=1871063 RepID=UPI0028AEBAB2|nr:DciA family protein [Aeromicrobium sp.]